MAQSEGEVPDVNDSMAGDGGWHVVSVDEVEDVAAAGTAVAGQDVPMPLADSDDPVTLVMGMDIGTRNAGIAVYEPCGRIRYKKRVSSSVSLTSEDVLLDPHTFSDENDAVHDIRSLIGQSSSGAEVESYVKRWPDVMTLVRSIQKDQLLIGCPMDGSERRIRDPPTPKPPSYVLSMLMRRLRAQAQGHYTRKLGEAVITVPSYFNDLQRQEIKSAARMSGIPVCRLLSEPVAAAIACHHLIPVTHLPGNKRTTLVKLDKPDSQREWGGSDDTDDDSFREVMPLKRRRLRKEIESEAESTLSAEDGADNVTRNGNERVILTIDSGCRATSVTLMSIQDNRIPVLASDVLMSAGDAVTDCLVDFFKGYPDLRGNEHQLWQACEQAKIRLTERAFAHISLSDTGSLHAVTRPMLVRVCNDLFSDMVQCVNRLILKAGIDVDDVVMIGGTSKILPDLKSMIGDLFPGKVRHLDPDHLIAVGAAVYAGSPGPPIIEDMSMTSLTAHVLHSDQDPVTLIPRGTLLPCEKDHVFDIVDSHLNNVVVHVTQRTSVLHTPLTGRLLIPGSWSEGRAQVHLSFRYDEEGFLSIYIMDPDSNKKTKLTLDYWCEADGLDEVETQREAGWWSKNGAQLASPIQKSNQKSACPPNPGSRTKVWESVTLAAVTGIPDPESQKVLDTYITCMQEMITQSDSITRKQAEELHQLVQEDVVLGMRGGINETLVRKQMRKWMDDFWSDQLRIMRECNERMVREQSKMLQKYVQQIQLLLPLQESQSNKMDQDIDPQIEAIIDKMMFVCIKGYIQCMENLGKMYPPQLLPDVNHDHLRSLEQQVTTFHSFLNQVPSIPHQSYCEKLKSMIEKEYNKQEEPFRYPEGEA